MDKDNRTDERPVKARVYRFHNLTDAILMFVIGIFLFSFLGGGKPVSQTWVIILMVFSLLNIRFGVYDGEK